jgi:hypothetical protein
MANNNNVIRFAGDVNVDFVEIVSKNGFIVEVTPQVIGIEIFEDLFTPFISGNIILQESLDFINLVPLTGEEFINIKLKTPSFTGKDKVIDAQFYIYKLSDRELGGNRNQIYRLHFISTEAIVDLNKKISKSFSGNVSEIARQLISDDKHGLESEKPLNIQNTTNSTKYVSNFWSPVKNLNYLAGTAINHRGSSDYIFYENRNGFNFSSLESLYYQPPVQEFLLDSFMRTFTPDGKNIRNVQEEYKRIIDIDVPKLYDYMENVRGGMMASKIITYDIVSKKYNSKNYNMLDKWFEHNHLNQYPLISKNNIDNAWSTIISEPKYYNQFNSYGDVTNTKTLQDRISKLLQAEGNRIEITVPGRTDYTVGMKVSLRVPKIEPLDPASPNQDIYDKILSGNYLIAALNHFITKEKHECRMELIKDSYSVNLDLGGKKQ